MNVTHDMNDQGFDFFEGLKALITYKGTRKLLVAIVSIINPIINEEENLCTEESKLKEVINLFVLFPKLESELKTIENAVADLKDLIKAPKLREDIVSNILDLTLCEVESIYLLLESATRTRNRIFSFFYVSTNLPFLNLKESEITEKGWLQMKSVTETLLFFMREAGPLFKQELYRDAQQKVKEAAMLLSENPERELTQEDYNTNKVSSRLYRLKNKKSTENKKDFEVKLDPEVNKENFKSNLIKAQLINEKSDNDKSKPISLSKLKNLSKTKNNSQDLRLLTQKYFN